MIKSNIIPRVVINEIIAVITASDVITWFTPQALLVMTMSYSAVSTEA